MQVIDITNGLPLREPVMFQHSTHKLTIAYSHNPMVPWGRQQANPENQP